MDDDVVTANAGRSKCSSGLDCLVEGMLNTHGNFQNMQQQTELKSKENVKHGKVLSDPK